MEPGGAPIEVRLQDARRSDWVIPACTEVNSSERIGFSVLFALPKTMTSSPENNNSDIFIYPRGGEAVSAELIISRSPEEITDAGDSLDFERFEERWIKDSAGNVVGLDARGRRKRGEYWRSAIFFGRDTTSYWLKSGEQPNVSDQVIDSACIAKR